MAKVKIPKKVAGIKVPKKVRKKAKKAIKAAESPVVRDFAAAAIGAVAERGASRVTVRLAGNGGGTARTARIDADRLVETIRTAAMDGMQRFLEGFEEGLREASQRAEVRGEEEEDEAGEDREPDEARAGSDRD